jgi:N-glycosidase YbiA
MSRPIRFFSRDSKFAALSNFAPYGFEVDGVKWPTVEHYFQAQKFTSPSSEAHRERIRNSNSPRQAKALGQSRSQPIRPDWDAVREDVMRTALRAKFTQPALRTLLLSTGDRPLVEDSPYDRYWGTGKDGRGKNRLGALLMELRCRLREESAG